MRTGTKMLMLTGNYGGSGKRNEMEMRRGGSGGRSEMEMRRGGSEGRNEYGRSEMGYEEIEMRRGGSGGRSEMKEDEWEQMESRRRFPRRRDGTFAPRSEYEGGGYPFDPPIFEGGERKVNPIGFVPSGYWDMEQNYGMYADHKPMNEMEYRQSMMEKGGASGKSTKLTEEMAEEWAYNMKNEDGSKGPHWSMEQTKQVMAQRGIECDPKEFWIIMNAMYSDYCKVFQKYNVNKADLYADLACAWLMDKDAVKDKAGAYYMHVVKH